MVTNLIEKPIGYKLVFTKKRNEHDMVTRFKVGLVAQGQNQRPGIDFEETYSPVMDSTTFRYLLTLAVQSGLQTRLMDVVTTYLYGNLDTEIYIEPPPNYVDHTPSSSRGKFTGLRICKALYGLKQSGRAWYHHLRTYLISLGFKVDPALPCIFVLQDSRGFLIIAVYVDDLNSIGTSELCHEVENLLTKQFEMKKLGTTTFCI